MADYYAVLNKTLAGFAEPNEQLRSKLYERARATISRQLDGRTPELDQDAKMAEMQKLETAIADIEAGFGAPPPVEDAPVEPVPEPQPAAETSSPAEPQESVAPAPSAKPVAAPPAPVAPPAIENPVEDLLEPEVPPAPPAQAPTAPTTPDPIAQALNELNATTPENKIVEPDFEPITPDSMPDLPIEIEVEPTEATALPELEIPPAPAMAPVSLPDHMPEIVSPAAAPDAPHAAPLPEINFGDPAQDETLFIPPATGQELSGSGKRKSKRWLLWVFLLLLIAGIAAAGWMNREPLMQMFTSDSELSDAQKPKPVKTISVKPEPVKAEPEPQTSEPIQQPKREERLTEEGDEVKPEVSVTTPIINEELTPAPSTATGDAETGAAQETTAGGSTRAILYEEGATSGTGVLDPGSVSWSIVKEAPSPGAEEESAIRARIEIPERKIVLIMTLKRNTDQALPASHLIELIFALPEDFSGGTIEAVNRFVLKADEQGRGDTLVAVPAAIADGIFLIALNNLAEAKATNENLLKTRSWIDIPIQYRTGRRALVTIEKGSQAQEIFEKVFAEWAQKG